MTNSPILTLPDRGAFTVGLDAQLERHFDKHKAVTRLGDGKMAAAVLNRSPGNTDDPVVIHNLKYWGTPRNDGFIMMKNEVQACAKCRRGKNRSNSTAPMGS